MIYDVVFHREEKYGIREKSANEKRQKSYCHHARLQR